MVAWVRVFVEASGRAWEEGARGVGGGGGGERCRISTSNSPGSARLRPWFAVCFAGARRRMSDRRLSPHRSPSIHRPPPPAGSLEGAICRSCLAASRLALGRGRTVDGIRRGRGMAVGGQVREKAVAMVVAVAEGGVWFLISDGTKRLRGPRG